MGGCPKVVVEARGRGQGIVSLCWTSELRIRWIGACAIEMHFGGTVMIIGSRNSI